ncbi:MAG: chromate transporter [Candidatus Cloacimonetes bacterium]|jgi:chromate transporter|nr:chromate transporter [Candidatus Cloacimonadota bacterium]MDY0337698.1 chromate transporter [Candidatus Cloacimonadaceae bacterium]MCB5269124.1 chromate transporter [Candidatus Cloacimonadota bacterium]MCK9333746.1 chromate transporter [Candidatus Cloacimonadota bacterium]MDD2544513.1 chromate transporter [Candidatus Cloacimonadota bacterium]
MIYLQMLFTFFKIGLFSFGGGYAILAMIQQEVVVKNAWLTEAEFVQVVAISQMTPGPIAINAATFIGYQKAGIPGSLLCTLGVILPSLIIMLLITISYLKLRNQKWFQMVFKRLRLLSIGLIAAALIMILGHAVESIFSIIIFALCFIATWRFKLNPFTMLIVSALAGIFFGSA